MNTIIVIVTGKIYQRILKTNGQRFEEKRDKHTVSKNLPKIPCNYKDKNYEDKNYKNSL